jgi:hypothetical protein
MTNPPDAANESPVVAETNVTTSSPSEGNT